MKKAFMSIAVALIAMLSYAAPTVKPVPAPATQATTQATTTATPSDYGFKATFGGNPTVEDATATSALFTFVTDDYPKNGFLERVFVESYATAPASAEVFKAAEAYLTQFNVVNSTDQGKWSGNPGMMFDLTHKNQGTPIDGFPSLALVVVRNNRSYLVLFTAPASSTTAGDAVETFFNSFDLK